MSEVILEPDRERGSGFLLKVGQSDQSYVDLTDPKFLEFDYVQRIADALDAFSPTDEPRRVIHIGGAAMTLARYVAATRPRSPQIVLEPDAALTALVRERLPLPPRSGIKVRPVDGRSGMSEMRADYADIVILDAFIGARVPADLTTTEFFATVATVLKNEGMLMLNLTDKAPFGYLRRVLAGLRQHFGTLALSAEPATLKGRRFGNILICAAQLPLPSEALSSTAARSPFPYRVLDDGLVHTTFADAEPFTAHDSSMSPEPPGGKTFFA